MAKRKPRRTDNVVAMPAVESKGVTDSQSVDLSESDIARRAFEIYCQRGCQHGHDLEDWLQAEGELRPTLNVAVA